MKSLRVQFGFCMELFSWGAKTLSSDRSQIYKELKQGGYSRDTVREIVRRRKMTLEQRQAAAATLDMYLSALGDFADTPLGQAGADRMQEDGRAA